jgi:hypothetical protein
MSGCDGCQERMLEHLYDALEEVEQRAFLDHLGGCPACQAALETARTSKALLGRAARLHFPGVVFAPPANEPLPGTGPVILPSRPLVRPKRTWPRLAVAAAVLLAVAGLSVPGYRAYDEYQSAARAVREHHDAVAEARAVMARAGDAINDAARDHERQLADVEREIKARELRLVVSGPRVVQPGAPTDFQVQAFDLNGQKADAEIDARLTDLAPRSNVVTAMSVGGPEAPAGRTEGKEAQGPALSVTSVGPGVYRVRIPASVRLDPNQAPALLVSARKKGGAGQAVSLQGQVRLTSSVYLTHLTTDKPMYQPGEVVRFRSLTLDRFTHKPVADDLRLHYTLTSPLGALTTVARGSPVQVAGKPVPGVGAGEVLLDPETTAGGEWTLTVTDEAGRFPPATRKFLVNRYQKPRLDKKLDFNRSSYGPGDEVLAKVSARRADGGAVANSIVEATVTVDGRTFDHDGKEAPHPIPGMTDPDGTALVRFTLPKAIERGQASLAVKFEDQGVVETIVRPIPLVLKKLDVEFFPEGGDLVPGAVNRVYFQARTMLGKPAQLRGTLLENGKPLPVKVETLHDDDKPGVNQGNGVFEFAPKAGATYTLRIDSPAGIAEQKVLPATREDGVMMSVPKGVFEANERIYVRVYSATPRSFLVGAYCRGQLLDTAELPRGTTEAVLQPKVGTGGVCRVTVFEELQTGQQQRVLKPVAERLVYRHPKERLDVSITADRRKYTPGQRATLNLATTGEKETLTPALALVAVVDKSVVVLADEKTHRSMPTHFLLTTEVRRADELEHADFLLGDHPKAEQALDLLLGTQGWRRFAEQDPERFRQRPHKGEEDDAERVLVMAGQGTPVTTDFDQEKRDRVTSEYEEKIGALQARHETAAAALRSTEEEEGYKTALGTLGRYHDAYERVREVAPGVLALLVLLIGVVLGAVAAKRAASRMAVLVGATAVCGLVLALAVLYLKPAAPGEMAAGDAPVEVAKMAPAAQKRARDEDRLAMDDRDKKAEGKDVLGGLPAPAAPPAAGEVNALGAPAAKMGPGGGGRAMPGRPPFPAMDELKADKPRMPAPPASRAAALPGAGKGGEAKKPAEAEKEVQPGELHEGLEKGRKQYDRPARGNAGGQDLRRRLADEGKPVLGADRGFAAKKLKGKDVLLAEPLVVREYAHARRPASSPGVRDDFTETLYWHPVLMLPDGKGTVSFDLCDSVTSFQVTVFAHTLDGRLGAATRTIESQLPFSLAAKVPVEVTTGDRIDVPVAVSNNTDSGREVELKLATNNGLDLLSKARESKLQVNPEGRGREMLSFKPNLHSGVADLSLECRTAEFRDGLREQIRVVPDGFPVSGASSDLLEASATHRLTLPRWLPGTLEVRVDVYPSTLADLQKGLAGLLREPHGCFEQSSTANYPNVLILDYLKNDGTPDPALEKQTRDLLDRGYRKLTSFECQERGAGKRQGYEWFGGSAPPHEALTAYGLLQFGDMAKVHDVDRDMLDRTRAYLLGQRDGAGGFKRNARALDTFGRAPEHITNAYIVWALTEAGVEGLSTELDALLKRAKTSDDPYYLSLTALGLTNGGRREEAILLLRKVAATQKGTGEVDGAKTSITGSGGRDLVIETTALATLAWLKADAVAFDAAVRKAVQWIGKQRGGEGAFGSTQATILALKALIAWAKANKRVAEAGELRLFVGDEKVAELRFPAGVDKPLTLTVPDAEKRLRPGENRLRVEITGANNIFPHTLGWSCRTATPASAKEPKVKLETKLAKAALAEGDTTRLTVKVTNVSGQDQGMAVAIVGLPAGLIVPEDLKQLKEHCKVPEDGTRPLLGAFEVQGRELVLYWRDLAKGQTVEVPVDLVAQVPGEYRGPASRAYLYYNADHKHWVEPLAATIAAK